MNLVWSDLGITITTVTLYPSPYPTSYFVAVYLMLF
jgi:hypothetical protein